MLGSSQETISGIAGARMFLESLSILISCSHIVSRKAKD